MALDENSLNPERMTIPLEDLTVDADFVFILPFTYQQFFEEGYILYNQK